MSVPEVRADFNERSGHYLLCLEEHLPPGCVPGTALLLIDGEGNQCFGNLDRVKGGLAYVIPLWNSWVAASE